MQKNKRSPILLLIAILVSLCICILATGLWIWNRMVSLNAQQPTAGPTAAEQTTAAVPLPPANQATATSSSSDNPDGLPAGVLADMEEIQAQVIEIRGLLPAGEFSREILSREELAERVRTDFFTDYTPEEAAQDAQILALLGLLEPDFDLIDLFTQLYSDQILGFYDDETQEMVVVGSGEFRGPEKITYAHEYAHALQNENFDFEDGLQYNDESCELDSERCGAIQALIEGEATLIELQWFFDHASQTDQQEIIEYYDTVDLSDYATYPAYLQKDFAFPYDQGYLFVETLYNRGGWDELNDTYADPPVSTEQILHPEKYPGDRPVSVDLPDALGALGEGWEEIDNNVLGEWYTYLLLAHGAKPSARIDDQQASEAAAGWGGDRYVVLSNASTGGLVLLMKSVWDSAADQGDYIAAFTSYADARFGQAGVTEAGGWLWEEDAGVHLFFVFNDGVVWVAAPDVETAEMLMGLMSE